MVNPCHRVCSTTNNKFRCLLVLGFTLSIFGSTLLVIWPKLFSSILNNELALSPKSKSYPLWKDIPVPMYFEFYLFNWTNPHEILNHNKKPILTEMGPYIFREHRAKIIENWFPENNTVTFRQNRTWFFEPSLSNGSLDDLVTTLNVPAITAAYALRDLPSYVKFIVNIGMVGLKTRLHVTRKVREFLFDGYDDPLLDLTSLIPSQFKPVAIPFDKFGWMYSRNGSATYDGVYNMKTGAGDINELGVLGEWDYYKNTHYYPSYCGIVNGSAGELFPPSQLTGRSISLFSSDICRTLDLNYKEKVVVNGLNGYRYWGDDRMFANQSSVPDNWCFCGGDGKLCYPNGVLNVTVCKWGAPAFVSFPHFYHADSSYRSAVEGMNPREDLHKFFLDLEPVTGIPLQVAGSFQINILLQPDKPFSILNGVPKIFFPMLWFRETAHMTDEIASELKLLLMVPQFGTISLYAILSVGLSIVTILAVFWVTLKFRSEDEALYLVSANQEDE